MILRPVSPASPSGPPISKLPVGFTNKSVRSSISSAPMAITTSVHRSRSIWSRDASGAWWAEISTRETCTGREPSYSTVTWVFPSGRRYPSTPFRRTSASRSAKR